MRIISGIHKGRIINPPKNLSVRPTTDRSKEALFNILNNLYDKQFVQHLFSGTGSVSFEFASRGVSSVTAVDQNRNIDYNTYISNDLDLNKTLNQKESPRFFKF